MSNKEIRETAKTILMENLSIAYYRLANNTNGWANGMDEKDLEQCYEWINRYGKAMAKSIGREYYTL